MSFSSSIDLPAVTQDWARLQESSHLGPILTDKDYEEQVNLLNALLDTVGCDEGHPLAGLVEVLGYFIEDYDRRHYAVEPTEPSEVLRYLMERHSFRQADLVNIGVGSQGVVSEILAGRRSINARQAKLLGARFKVSPAVFL